MAFTTKNGQINIVTTKRRLLTIINMLRWKFNTFIPFPKRPAPNARPNVNDLFGWVDSVTSSTISLSCVEIKWEPEKRSGIKETINIDRYTGKIFIEEFGYAINNDKMAHPFTISELYGHCELAKPKFWIH